MLYAPITRVRSRQRKYGREYIDFHTELMDKWIALGLGQNRLLGHSRLPSWENSYINK